MIPDRLSADQIRAYEQQLLERVPADSPIGNVNLRSQLSQLGWNESQYWDIRNHLMARGVLVSGKGKGGSVRRVVPVRTSTSDIPVAGAPATTTDPIPAHAPDHLRKAENKLYVPMAETIRKGWAKDLGLDAFVVEITAYSGPKAGKWAHPDVTLASSPSDLRSAFFG